ncbi:MAG: hypothetical protein AAF902_25930, partial [Chloroflexota bacterium]
MKILSRLTLLSLMLLALSITFIALYLPIASGSNGCYSGTYTSDLTFTAAQSPICIDSDLQMLDGSSLTIEPGVIVEFSGAYEILIRSQISAAGTPADPIIFKSINNEAAAGATFLKFFGATLGDSSLSHIQFNEAGMAIQIGDETEFNQGGKNSGTL